MKIILLILWIQPAQAQTSNREDFLRLFELPKIEVSTDFMSLAPQMPNIFGMDGTESGNGGFTVSCGDLSRRDFVDVYGMPRNDHTFPHCENNPHCILENRISQLKILNPGFSKILKRENYLFSALFEIVNPYDHVVSLHLDSPALVGLYKSSEFGDSCVFDQLFTRISDKKTKKIVRYVLLSHENFLELNASHQAAAILHEILYSVIFQLQPQSPDAFKHVVALNRFIHKLPNLDNANVATINSAQQELQQLLKNIK